MEPQAGLERKLAAAVPHTLAAGTAAARSLVDLESAADNTAAAGYNLAAVSRMTAGYTVCCSDNSSTTDLGMMNNSHLNRIPAAESCTLAENSPAWRSLGPRRLWKQPDRPSPTWLLLDTACL